MATKRQEKKELPVKKLYVVVSENKYKNHTSLTACIALIEYRISCIKVFIQASHKGAGAVSSGSIEALV